MGKEPQEDPADPVMPGRTCVVCGFPVVDVSSEGFSCVAGAVGDVFVVVVVVDVIELLALV